MTSCFCSFFFFPPLLSSPSTGCFSEIYILEALTSVDYATCSLLPLPSTIHFWWDKKAKNGCYRCYALLPAGMKCWCCLVSWRLKLFYEKYSGRISQYLFFCPWPNYEWSSPGEPVRFLKTKCSRNLSLPHPRLKDCLSLQDFLTLKIVYTQISSIIHNFPLWTSTSLWLRRFCPI